MTSTTPSEDILLAALKSNIVPNQEYLLQGSVLDSAVDVLLHRVRGLADNIDEGPETFDDHEQVLTLGPVPTQGSIVNVGHGLTLYVRRAREPHYANLPWTLRYIGQPEAGDKSRPTLLRNSIDVACSPNIVEFLSELGAKLEYEFRCQGYIFRKGRLKILIYKLFRSLPHKPNTDNWEQVSVSHLVELSVMAPKGHDAVASDIKAFAEQLKPLVQMEKIDYKRLQHM